MSNKKNKEKILVALSGGVDSAVCAHLLCEEGYDAACAMMRLHDGPQVESEINAAREIAQSLKLPFYELDYRAEFKRYVMDYFTLTYLDGRTPNPCIECNRHLKFGMLFKAANELGCNKIATGHYAKIVVAAKNPENGQQTAQKFSLQIARDTTKDQSYVLHFLNQEQLSKILLPLGTLTKNDVREIAANLNLPCANQPESQDICFVEDGDYSKFVTENANKAAGLLRDGNIKTVDGKIVGTHKGLINYTIGQRKGIDIAFGEPMYVTKIDADKNELVMGTRKQACRSDVEIHEFSWIEGQPPSNNFKALVKLRYRQKQAPCEVLIDNDIDIVKLELQNPIDSVTPGQFGVLYDGERVLGGGVIK